ncbi:MAG: hypothetical protein ABWY25_01510 [Paenisporosarcina sp.]
MESTLKFKVENATSIRVLDESINKSLVGKIIYNSALDLFEFDPLDGDYVFSAGDLQMIASYMSKVNISTPKL